MATKQDYFLEEKCIFVWNSCKTEDQLLVAMKYLALAERRVRRIGNTRVWPIIVGLFSGHHRARDN